MLKTLVVLEMFSFLFSLFAYVEKRLDKKAMVNSRIYYITDWPTNNYNAHITQDLKK